MLGNSFAKCSRHASMGVLAPAVLMVGCLKTPDRHAQSTLDVNVNPPATFELQGEPFCFHGSNNYYPVFKPPHVVDDLFAHAQKIDFKVMRVWSMLDIGSLDGSVPHVDGEGKKQDVYLQYWDTQKQQVACNETETGLPRLDYVLDSAARHNIKLILVMVNNWHHFGGMDQYVVWHQRQHHHEFYTDPEIKQTYKSWLHHVITRTNTVNGRAYRDDPTIFSWELANEPRCIGAAGRDSKQGWDKSTITAWADEMSRYIKSLDPNHMVSVGDEGFLDGGGSHWAYEANDGVDHEALTALPNIDFGTFHLYPEDWGVKLEWGDQWIIDHLRVARKLGKPTVLEEYGVKVGRSKGNLGRITKGWGERKAAYVRWNDIMLRRGGNGSLVWILAGRDDVMPRYPDYDHFGFWSDSPTGVLLEGYAEQFKAAAACRSAGGTSADRSPFVRVRKSEAQQVAALNPSPWRLL
jgi:mannan endo-1,4-beta-mannosidase